MSTNPEYLKSENVKVFPYGSERSTDTYGRILNEQNIARMVRSLTDKDSYIISADLKNSKYDFKVIIHGYYFELASITAEANLKATIYTTVVDPETLYAGDDDGNFTGIELHTSNAPIKNGCTPHSLKLFDSNGALCEDSFHKISVDSIEDGNMMLIDCGTATTVL